ncbi:type I-E CRISPR-associated protein Cas7/Cse4/CasC [Prauserella marina]|uniref:CRISPR system Cascade subunit CasC n=1 Tax=Prauserella marina TaxID=530584 RepID=A0A222VMY3_9PSEU|nr:type I-E CRISPR-associated protein Cas7/Cse4/CasC [Prauserella marina]ASR35275.1 type I-E CRISPR-associated protein Cas7/Cse4/CasC [Prauserella marina]PWV84949.1 CRISPR-associated Cse4 family protein [Prauserella marina]SDC08537.1 CRISPR system Cascade subunit CasC [Prauserella marina]
MNRTIVDIHVIQTVPPSNINRDDTGSPKTAVYGGKRRARVSSQAWKRATRDDFSSFLDLSELGMRTKRVVELLTESIQKQDTDLVDQAEELATEVLSKAGIKLKAARKKDAPQEAGYLLFLSNNQIEALAELAVDAAHNGDGTVSKQDAKARADRQHSVDIALFGRMVADDADLNVDAAAQVAHALSVHEVSNEYDYYTAVDDHKRADEEEDAGAGMIGTVEFNSSTLYRYATVDVDRLRDNLGDVEATRRAVVAFARSFVTSMPTGKQNTFANRTLPDAVLILVRDTQSMNLVGAFEEVVDERESSGRIGSALTRLVGYGTDLHAAYDETPVAGWSVGIGERAEVLTGLASRTSFESATTALSELVAERLGTS